MGAVISLAEHRRRRPSAPPPHRVGAAPRATFYFDLGSPATYLAAERADRLFPGLEWRPALAEALHAGSPRVDRAALTRRAASLRLPLVWPERWPWGGAPAMRAAALACEQGHGGAFVLAASRLAFCGGFDLDEPECLAEAAAAADLDLDACLAAAGDTGRDGAMAEAGRRLLAAGADALPAVHVGHALFCGEERLGEAAAAVRGLRRTPAAV